MAGVPGVRADRLRNTGLAQEAPPVPLPELPEGWRVLVTEDWTHSDGRIIRVGIGDETGPFDSREIPTKTILSESHLRGIVVQAANEIWHAMQRNHSITDWLENKSWEQ